MGSARKLSDLLDANGDVKLDALSNVSADLEGLSDTTVSELIPTITTATPTNGINLGHIWIDKALGEAYICTDATTGANIWTNIGGGSGNVSPNDLPVIPSGGLTVTPTLFTNLSTGVSSTHTFSGATDTEDGTVLTYTVESADIKDSFGNVITDLTVATTPTQGELIFTAASGITNNINGVEFSVTVEDSYGNTVTTSPYTINLLANQVPLITNMKIDDTAHGLYSWANLNAGTTTYKINGATDPDGVSANIVYTIENIQNDGGKITPSGGVYDAGTGADNVSITVATLTADITGVTFDVVATDEDSGTATSTGHTLDLISWSAYDVDYLIIAGAGGGGNRHSGGGGGGGYLTGTYSFSGTSATYTTTVGGGGTGSTGADFNNGTSSSVFSLTSIGGGAGTNNGGGHANCSGGSGGGGSNGASGGSGTTGQGNNGGGSPAGSNGAGGGGAGAAGANGTGFNVPGAGGIGAVSSIITTTMATSASIGEVSGSSVYYSGGGGGGNDSNITYITAGGLGGAGRGSGHTNAGENGESNTGGGGGGGGADGAGSGNGGNGGKGVVILKVPNGNLGSYTGSPTVDTTSISGYTLLMFKDTGSYTS